MKERKRSKKLSDHSSTSCKIVDNNNDEKSNENNSNTCRWSESQLSRYEFENEKGKEVNKVTTFPPQVNLVSGYVTNRKRSTMRILAVSERNVPKQ